jgi:hypothetical protein
MKQILMECTVGLIYKNDPDVCQQIINNSSQHTTKSEVVYFKLKTEVNLN